MKRFLCCLALLLQIVTWVSATSRLLDHDHASHQLGIGSSPQSSQAPYSSEQVSESNAETISGAGSYYRGVNKLGSRPPNCEHKCDGCMPCVPIKIPTITGHFGIQYANYEPESWKCKCGPTIYSP